MLLSISESWQNLALISKIYWCFAIPFSLVFILQLIMTIFIGDVHSDVADGHADVTVDHDAGIGFQFISMKNLIAFFTIFGWSGLVCINAGCQNWVTILLSTLCGMAMMLLMATIVYFMGKLTESGTLNMQNAIGKIGTVYLTIPPKRSAMGKVQVKVQGLQTLDAYTDNDESIKTGALIEVVDIINDEILLVKPSGNQ
ncbi:MAG: hypothetical protein JXB49_09880 [Bacteroidales bacterium]|nr:hypothetical protein [Bacteroidales bacterium]